MTKNSITRMNKKLAPLRAKNDVTHAVQLKLHERMNKKWLRRHGRNKNHDEIKNTKRRPIIAPAIAVRLLKMCEQILKKDSAPIQFKFFEL